jgi:predicted short-subunit dehydrogenase-like oxidoreductase (DUF2520 family)
MTAADAALLERLWIVGAGRAGLALALLLERAGAAGRRTVIGRRAQAPDHPLFVGDALAAEYLADLPTPNPPPSGIVIAVPDDAIAEVAERLAALALPAGTPVVHLSGALGLEPLESLARAGAVVGGVHPLRAITDGVAGAEQLRGAYFGVEGEGAARSLAERIVAAAEGRVLEIAPGAKALYHASAVLASNYMVALLAAAESLAERAGLAREVAHGALSELATGALAAAAERGPAAALTGPIARGDAETVRAHLAQLSGGERRLYSVLGREALLLARARGLDAAAAGRIERLLDEDPDPSESA